MFNPGDVVLTFLQFADSFEVKKRPAVVLYEDFGNVVIAGVTSNLKMKGVPLTTSDGAVKDSVIKLNYIFTVSEAMVIKVLFRLAVRKRKEVHQGLIQALSGLDTAH